MSPKIPAEIVSPVQRSKTAKTSLGSSLFSFLDSKVHAVCLVSGGVDSMVLMELAAQAQKERGFKLSVLHFNFNLRGKESLRDEKFVLCEGKKRLLPVVVIQAPIKQKTGIQNEARQIRYNFIREKASLYGWTHALVAHHANDQAETILMRLQRGAGLRGLKGMDETIPLTEQITLVRPLLPFTRQEILDYAARHRILFVEDSSNQQNHYLRNTIRHTVLAELEKEEAGIVSKLADSAKLCQVEYRKAQKKASVFLEKKWKRGRWARFDKTDYFVLDADARFLVLEEVLKYYGFEKQLESKHVRELEALLRSDKSCKKNLGHAQIAMKRKEFVVWKSQESARFDESCQIIADKGKVVSLEWIPERG